MVCFSQHNFRFKGKQREVYFPLLLKFYRDAPITVFLQQTAEGEGEGEAEEYKQGKINEEFFSTLREDAKITAETSITLLTERIWSEYACIRTLPRYVAKSSAVADKATSSSEVKDASGVGSSGSSGAGPSAGSSAGSSESSSGPSGAISSESSSEASSESDETTTPSLKVSKALDGLIKRRIDAGGCDILLECKFPEASWETLLKAFDELSETSHITRLLLCQKTGVALMVLKDKWSLFIFPGGAFDVILPTFDIDDGFIIMAPTTPRIPELTEAFEVWKKKFDQ